MNETKLENMALDWFRDTAWETLYGPDIAPDSVNPAREDYTQVVLKEVLIASLIRLNPHLPESCIEQVLTAILKPDSLDLITNNRAFHQLLLKGVEVQYKQDDQVIHSYAFLIDFDTVSNNRFQVVNQFTIQGVKQLRRPDVVCFINGLPMVVLELKSPTDESADIVDAFNQIQTYKDEISDLFVFNEAIVISDGLTARIGSLTANQERFMPWRTVQNENDQPMLEWQLEVVIRGFFNPELLLNYIRHFIIFENNGEKIVKKIAGYHQFHAVREAVKATIEASSAQGDKKAGVVWHTQGSGKSISMCCYAGMLLQQQAMGNPTLVVVTDRNDLDGQLFTTFSNTKALFKQCPVQANGRDELRNVLAYSGVGGIIFTTMQKFSLLDGEDRHPVLNDRHNIVVISDEAHRTQYGLKAKLNKAGGYQYGLR